MKSAVSVLAGACLVWMATPAPPAMADPAVPTNYTSEVTGIEPAVDGVEAEVVGGDAFLSVHAGPGTELVVLGYRDEPYLRIDPEGAVWRNRRSPATYLNDDRYGQREIPAEAEAAADPEWELIGGQGRWSWHDHRIHWMSPDRPPQLTGDREQEVFEWEVPMLVDGEEVVVTGRLAWRPDVSPFPAALVGLAGLIPLVAVRRRSSALMSWFAIGAGGVGAVAAIGQWLASPADARGFPVAATFLGVAVVVALASLRFDRARSARSAAIAGALLAGWGWSRLATLTRPIVPSVNPEWLDRGATALVLVTGVAVVVAALTLSGRLLSDEPQR